jgi:cytochrome c biogenesis protein CcmG/thiol:disulfide interchange protein DsbE
MARRRARPARWIAVAVGVVLALLVAVLATRAPATDRLVRSPLVGKGAPAIEATTVDGDAAFSLDAHRGQFVLVNFFATWCAPCQAEHDDLKRFAQAHAAAGDAAVVSVVFSDETADVKRFFQERGGDWPVVRDDDGVVATDWGVARVPESYLVAPSGLVIGKVTGGVTFDFLQEQLARLQASG